MSRRSYILRNTTKYDINLGDLRYKIPAGRSRDLYSPTAHLRSQDIKNSMESGSIAARIKTGALIQTEKFVKTKKPPKVLSSEAVRFHRNKKTSITLDVVKLDEQLFDMVLEEEDELLKELQDNDMSESVVPLTHKNEGNEPKT